MKIVLSILASVNLIFLILNTSRLYVNPTDSHLIGLIVLNGVAVVVCLISAYVQD